jgi:hypothetical protein
MTGAETWEGSSGMNIFQIQTNANYFKTFQNLTDPKTAFFKIKYGFEALKKMNFIHRSFF